MGNKVIIRIGEMHTAFSQLSPAQYNAALDTMIGFCCGYVPDGKWESFVLASIGSAKEREREPKHLPPKAREVAGVPRPSGKDAAAGPDK